MTKTNRIMRLIRITNWGLINKYFYLIVTNLCDLTIKWHFKKNNHFTIFYKKKGFDKKKKIKFAALGLCSQSYILQSQVIEIV